MTKYFFLPKKKMHFSKKLQFFSLRKGNLWRKILFYFLRVLTHNFERIHHETNWSDSGLGGLFYFIFNLMTPVKNIINFQFTIYRCIPLLLHPLGINRPWQDGWMTRWMWSIISSICLIIAGLWHVCHLFLLLSPHVASVFHFFSTPLE